MPACDWHGEGTPATARNSWTNRRGERRWNSLCYECQKKFAHLWAELEVGSHLGEKPDRWERPKRGHLSQSQMIKIWAREQGYELASHGPVPYHIKKAWVEAGRPNPWDDEG